MSGIIAQNSGRHTGLVKASSGGGGVWNLIQTLTSDGSDGDLSFTSGIDSTYDEYVFKIINMHPETNNVDFVFQGNTAGGSGYNETITSTFIRAYHEEGGGASGFGYSTGSDKAQGTDFQILLDDVGNDNDQCGSGYLHLYNPSSTTFVKNFIATMNYTQGSDEGINTFVSGYFNTTTAIDEIQFKFESEEIQGGSISLYGIT